jgi:Uncharacterized protein conserved in bacteria (DUF2312)
MGTASSGPRSRWSNPDRRLEDPQRAVRVLREILRLRKLDKDERDEHESLLDLYLRAMGSAGPSQAEAA